MASINADRHGSTSCYSILEGTCALRNVHPACDCSSYGTGREAAGLNLERENECVTLVYVCRVAGCYIQNEIYATRAALVGSI